MTTSRFRHQEAPVVVALRTRTKLRPSSTDSARRIVRATVSLQAENARQRRTATSTPVRVGIRRSDLYLRFRTSHTVVVDAVVDVEAGLAEDRSTSATARKSHRIVTGNVK